MGNTFESTRAYLVGRKVLLERNMEKLQAAKDAFETDCIAFMEKLEAISRSGSEKYQAEIDKLKLSIDLHQGMLVALDEENDVSDIDLNLDARRELNNLETVLCMTDNKIKQLFAEKPKGPQVVKRTVVTEKPDIKAIVEEKFEVAKQAMEDPQKAKELLGLFKEPFQYNPYPENYYIRPNGYVNNQFVGERVYEYMRDYQNEMTTKEMAEWIKEMFPKAKDRWASFEKGAHNVIHLHLKKNDLVETTGRGTWKVKERV